MTIDQTAKLFHSVSDSSKSRLSESERTMIRRIERLHATDTRRGFYQVPKTSDEIQLVGIGSYDSVSVFKENYQAGVDAYLVRYYCGKDYYHFNVFYWVMPFKRVVPRTVWEDFVQKADRVLPKILAGTGLHHYIHSLHPTRSRKSDSDGAPMFGPGEYRSIGEIDNPQAR